MNSIEDLESKFDLWRITKQMSSGIDPQPMFEVAGYSFTKKRWFYAYGVKWDITIGRAIEKLEEKNE